jgi:enoyl-CoA hydratase/carnithine racemase
MTEQTRDEAPHLLTETTDDGVLIATLNRPDKLNAISRQMMDLLTEAVLRFRDDDDLKVFLIRSHGRYFSSGADLRGGDQKVVSPSASGNGSARGLPRTRA